MSELTTPSRCHAERAAMGVFLAGGRDFSDLRMTFDYWHPSVQRERCDFWQRYGTFLARQALIDAAYVRQQAATE